MTSRCLFRRYDFWVAALKLSDFASRLVKIWDYQNKNCVQTLEGHTQNVSFAAFHPELPIIISGSEDGTVRLWHANTYRLENTLNYGLERAWSIAYQRGNNNVAFGYDEGAVVVKLGREEPAISMDGSGKIIWARHSEILTANVKASVGKRCRYSRFEHGARFAHGMRNVLVLFLTKQMIT